MPRRPSGEGADHGGSRAVAKQDADVSALVRPVDPPRKHFAAGDQDVPAGPPADELVGQSQPVDQARALLLDVERGDRAQSEFRLQEAGRAGVGVIGGDGVHHQEVDLVHRQAGIGHGRAARRHGQVRGGQVRLRMPPPQHAGPLNDEPLAGLHHPRHVKVRDHPRRQERTGAKDT